MCVYSLVIDCFWTCHSWKASFINSILLREWQKVPLPDTEINIDSDLSTRELSPRTCAASEYRKQVLNITFCIFSKYSWLWCLWYLDPKTILINIAAVIVSVSAFLSFPVKFILRVYFSTVCRLMMVKHHGQLCLFYRFLTNGLPEQFGKCYGN